MPKYTSLFIRTSFIYLLIGTFLGFLLLTNKAYNFNFKIWSLLPIHIDLLIYGWFLQFIFGMSFWMMPRYVSAKPYGNEELVSSAYTFVNIGLLVKVLFSSYGLIIIIIGMFLFVSNVFLRVRHKML